MAPSVWHQVGSRPNSLCGLGASVAVARPFSLQPEPVQRRISIAATAIPLIAAFTTVLAMGGFSSSFHLAAVSSLVVFALLLRAELLIAICGSALLLSLFDNEEFVYEVMGIDGFRLAYVPLALLLPCWLLSSPSRDTRVTGIPAAKAILIVAVFYFAIHSAVLVTVEPLTAKLWALKYWLFYYLPLLVIPACITRKRGELLIVLLVGLAVFVSAFGFLQYAANCSGYSSFQLHYYNRSPEGFFSERTWYGEFAVLALPLLAYLDRRWGVRWYVLCSSILVGAVLLSICRGAYLGLAVFFLLGIGRGSCRILAVLAVLLSASFIAAPNMDAGGGHGLSVLEDAVNRTFSRFSLNDGSSESRLEAIEMTLERYREGSYSIWGNGFTWDEYDDTSSAGTAIGAKSANLFAFVMHTFGAQGLLLLLILIASFYYHALAVRPRNDLLWFASVAMTMWLVMAQFSPLHQYANTVLVLAVIIGMFLRGCHERSDSVYRAVS